MAQKIIISVSNDLSQDQRMKRISTSFVEEGYSVVLVGRSKRDSIPLSAQKYKQKRLHVFFERGPLFYLEYNFRLLIYLFFADVDIYYSVDLDTILPATITSILKGKKHLHDAHEYFVEVPELNHKKLKKFLWNNIAKSCYPKCDAWITVNDYLAQELTRRYGGEWESIMNVPQIYQLNKPNRDKHIVLYQGMLNQGRGLEEIISVVSKIELPIELWIVGRGDIEQELVELISSLDHSNRVKMLGWKNIEEMRSIAAQSWIGINLLSSTSLNYYYSLANKFFEYIHSELPAINMNFPVYRQINEKSEVALLIDSLEEEVIKQAIYTLYTDQNLYQKLKENTRYIKKKYHWENEQKKLHSIINNINKL